MEKALETTIFNMEDYAMKTVSKLFTAAAIAFAAVACQVIDEGQVVKRQLEVTATIAEDDESKVDYDVDNDSYTISPTWHYNKDKPEECDQIIGFDNLGNTFTFTVSGVSGNGKIATFKCSYVPHNGSPVKSRKYTNLFHKLQYSPLNSLKAIDSPPSY